MRKLMMSMVLLAMAGCPAALAQSGANGSQGGLSSTTNKPTTGEAPVGHRQPRAGDVPSEKNLSDPNNPANREDAVLDRKIKSICRGC